MDNNDANDNNTYNIEGITIIDNFIDQNDYQNDDDSMFDDEILSPIVYRLLNYNTLNKRSLFPYKPVYTENENCDKCNVKFDKVFNNLIKLQRSTKSWKSCPTDISFESENKTICLLCTIDTHGITCTTCNEKYLYTDSFYDGNECKDCYIKQKKGCIVCSGFINKYNNSKLCSTCRSEFESLEIFTKHMMTDRDIRIHRKQYKGFKYVL